MDKTEAASTVLVTFRKNKAEFTLQPDLTVGDVKARLVEEEVSLHHETATTERQQQQKLLVPSDIKLLFKGKVLEVDDVLLVDILNPSSAGSKTTKKKVYKMIAMGRSSNEVREIQGQHAQAKKQAPRIRDDLTQQGQREADRRKLLGRQMLQKASQQEQKRGAGGNDNNQNYGFGRIETLPNLPDQDKAKQILTQLSKDPGILACMKKHNWHVGSLAELYPEGKVGETDVCVMGLNRNKGQQILLRIRTDDLQGFRKILSIRKVLFHELAHNVHSEHDQQFFQLMRQIETECNEMDWTKGSGLSSAEEELQQQQSYSGGTYRLGGGNNTTNESNGGGQLSAREIRAQAALNRMTAEEDEIQQHCGCGGAGGRLNNLFLPQGIQPNNNKEDGTGANDNPNDRMDLS